MQILINSTPVNCGETDTLETILAANGIPSVNVAVAVDNMVIPKNQWGSTYVREGTDIMVIKAVQGG